jgi:hypothetical protein
MRRVLFVSPHFPPDTSAATHRARLLAPHLEAAGWSPTILTCTPASYATRLDPDLLALVPASLRVERVDAWPERVTRRFGVGDLGFRARIPLRRRARALLAAERYDALVITTYPTYPATFGPALAREAGIPFVLDLQDPWVGAWGLTTGPHGVADLRSRLSRAIAVHIERRTARGAAALTAVSARTYQDVQQRVPEARALPCAEIPLGGDERDFAHVRTAPWSNPWWTAGDGRRHLAWVGTLLPTGIPVIRALLAAVRDAVERDASLASRLVLHFIGTSNETRSDAPQRALPIARELGVERFVTEHAPRVDYLDALRVLVHADAIVLAGSIERHYTASRLYPALLAARPLIACYHEASSVVTALRAAVRFPTARLVTFGDAGPDAATVAALTDAFTAAPEWRAADVDRTAIDAWSARAMAGRLGALLDRVAAPHT